MEKSLLEKSVMELKTVRRSDPEFQTLLDGTFSDTHRAIPLRTINQHLTFELATFELTPISKIKKPNLFAFTFELLKPQHFLIVLIPLIYTFLSLSRGEIGAAVTESVGVTDFFLHKEKMILLFISLLNLTLFINLRRTLIEHKNLSHLYSSATTSSILQKGWLKAITVQKLSWIFLASAIVAAVPLIAEQPAALAPIVLLTVVLFTGMSLQKEGKIYLITSAINHFILAGPLVVLGTCIVFHSKPTTAQWAFAVSWGLWILLWRQLRSFRELMPYTLSGSSRFVAQMGFDKTLSLLQKLVITIPMISMSLLAFMPLNWIWMLTNASLHSYFIIKEMECLNKTQSSLSSHLEELASIAQKHHYFFALTQLILSVLTLPAFHIIANNFSTFNLHL